MRSEPYLSVFFSFQTEVGLGPAKPFIPTGSAPHIFLGLASESSLLAHLSYY